MANKNEKATFDAAGKSEAFFTKYRNVILGAVAAIILVVVSMRKTKGGGQPAHCGVNYYREER